MNPPNKDNVKPNFRVGAREEEEEEILSIDALGRNGQDCGPVKDDGEKADSPSSEDPEKSGAKAVPTTTGLSVVHSGARNAERELLESKGILFRPQPEMTLSDADAMSANETSASSQDSAAPTAAKQHRASFSAINAERTMMESKASLFLTDVVVNDEDNMPYPAAMQNRICSGARNAESTLMAVKGTVFVRTPPLTENVATVVPDDPNASSEDSCVLGDAQETAPALPELHRDEIMLPTRQPGAVAVAGMNNSSDDATLMIGLEEGTSNGRPNSGTVDNTRQSSDEDSAAQLFVATLVNEREPGEVVEAKPALEGFQALIHNRRFKYVVGILFVLIVASLVPLVVVTTREAELPLEATCGTRSNRQADYRGTLNVAASGYACLQWSETHNRPDRPDNFRIENYGSAGLEENYCRNPNNQERAWCFTNENSNEQFCDVPYCEEELKLNTTCGTKEHRFTDYRGPINVTIVSCTRFAAVSFLHLWKVLPGVPL
ncbi:Salivary plasminogen activator [Seminavis robusta]|uniref:Salivary plasminogen activator n=1 Tax=Seminavis robusta TaxID=568900 RepID=A0A9N8E7E0_9STRA|nr:Salivary plasminogen activator [Seminavis robusta]|eukprot:Sro746_g196390.1 Salivary plasminogen activator (492) ;mRNA; r:15323-17077